MGHGAVHAASPFPVTTGAVGKRHQFVALAGGAAPEALLGDKIMETKSCYAAFLLN